MDTSRKPSILEKPVSLRLVVLLFLILLVLAVLFGWKAVQQATDEADTRPGKMALEVAQTPDQVIKAFENLQERISGSWEDRSIRVARGEGLSLDGFTPIASAIDMPLEGLLIRTGPAPVTPAWRFLAGGFHLDGEPRYAALLLSPELEVVHAWTLTEEGLPDSDEVTEHSMFPHGIDLLPDLSVVFAFDNGAYLQRFDACSQRLWATHGPFHHAVQLDEDRQTVWALLGSGATQVRVQDGKKLKVFNLHDMLEANPDQSLLEIHRENDTSPRSNTPEDDISWIAEPVHFNDVEALPSALAAAFPGFAPGDLLISSRALNAVLVVDPESYRIKWWRAGATQRQHDPDWLPNGEILVFNNRTGRTYSNIVAIDPKTHAARVVHDGADNAFYSRIRGKSQMMWDGTLNVTSSQQGRVFEIAPDGQTALEIVNLRHSPAQETDESFNYILSEMRVFTPDFIDPALPGLACAGR